MQSTFDKRRDISVGSDTKHNLIAMSGKLVRKSSQPLSILNTKQIGRKTPIKQSREKDKDGDPSSKNQISNTKYDSKHNDMHDDHHMIDIDKNPEQLLTRYGYLIKSKNVPPKKAIDYLVVVVKGLHYSIKCLKPPTLKFVQSKKINISDTLIGILDIIT